jgi:hypothetical protein
MIDEVLGKLGIDRAVFVVHSWSGALGARLALDHPGRVAGLVMLAPVTHPWRGGVGRYNEIIATPVIGPLLAYTITLPLGYFLSEPGARNVFLPQTMPDGFVQDSATPLLLRPREFIANAYDLVTLKQAVAAQAPRYGEISAPVTIIAGEPDKTVKTDIHARPFAATVPNARLIVLPDLGHMVQNAVPDLVKTEIETMIRKLVPAQAAADSRPPLVRLLLDLPVLVELRHIGPEIVDLGLVLDAGECHLGAGDLGLRVLDVFLENGLVPGDAGILVGVGVIVVRRGAGFAAVEAVELGADLVLGAFADSVTGQAFVERRLAGRDVLRHRGGCGGNHGEDGQCAKNQFCHRVLFVSSLGAGQLLA